MKKKKPSKASVEGKLSGTVKKTSCDLFNFFQGNGSINGDIVSPALSPKEWGGLYPTKESLTKDDLP
jgi:hypothetical protein